MGARRRGRELAMQALYMCEVTGRYDPEAIAHMWEQAEAPDEARRFASQLVQGVRERQVEIDQWIARAAENWRLERMSPVDLCILRVATFELLAEERPPTAVILDEAIEIAKRFGTADSYVFINGVLDRIAKELGVKDTAAASAANRQ